MKILIAILSVVICLFSFGTDLSAQEKDNKMLEVSCYYGTGRASPSGGNGSYSEFDVPCFGLGMEYFITPRISFEYEVHYLPNSSRMVVYLPEPLTITYVNGEWLSYIAVEGANYRLLGGINFLFYFDIPKSKKTAQIFLTIGALSIYYDHAEYTIIIPSISEQYEYREGKSGIPRPILPVPPFVSNFGVGVKVKIKGDWSLRLLYKIHGLGGEELQTNRLAFGLSYRFK